MQQLPAPSGALGWQRLLAVPQLPCLQNARQRSKRGTAALWQRPLLRGLIPGVM